MPDQTESRKAHWEAVFSRKNSSELSWYAPHLRHSLSLIDRAGISKNSSVIDVGGGDSTFVDDLLDRGYSRLTVLDISSEALERTKQRLGPRASLVNWIVGDVTTVPLRNTFRLWHDRAAFHFLTDPNDRVRYVERLKSALVEGGYVIIATFAMTGPEKCSGLPTQRYSAETLLSELGPSFGLIETLEDHHQTPAGKNQDFMYTLFRRIDSSGIPERI